MGQVKLSLKISENKIDTTITNCGKWTDALTIL